MTRQEYMVIARVIGDLPSDRLLVAHRFAAMLAERDPAFDRNWFLAAALWGIERRANRAVTTPYRRSRTRRAPTQAMTVGIKLGH